MVQSIRYNRLFVIGVLALLITVVSSQTLCDPKKTRHCFPFGEHDVESTFDGVGDVSSDAPVIDEKTNAPVPDLPAPDDNGNDESSSETDRSTNGGGLHTGAIVAMSLGGALLLVGAGVMRRRIVSNDGDLSAMDSTSIQPSGDDAA